MKLSQAVQPSNDFHHASHIVAEQDQDRHDSTEPFPEYFSSCEQEDSHVDDAQEEAYRYALSKVVEAVKAGARSIKLDPTYMTARLLTTEWELPSSDTGPETAPASPRDETTEPQLDNYPSLALCAGLKVSEENKKNILEEMRILTNSASLSLPLRRRFITMCNEILRIHILLFRRATIPGHPIDTITTRQFHRAQQLSSKLVAHLSALDQLLQTQHEQCHSAQQRIMHISTDQAQTPIARFKTIATILINTLPPPRQTEQRLLLILLDLYDAYLYTDYHHLRQWPQMLTEGENPARLSLTNTFFRAWNLLTGAIERYQAIAAAHADLTHCFIRPGYSRLAPEAPRIWFDLHLRRYVALHRERLRVNQLEFLGREWGVVRREGGGMVSSVAEEGEGEGEMEVEVEDGGCCLQDNLRWGAWNPGFVGVYEGVGFGVRGMNSRDTD
ncbi:uncharacterized protein BO97DRAFT_460370 [Aspergillus homomorphus CBS 101889]|uniref:Uncharacterized protein n=1 Tax=Aspergillus homomorphus (strain CBS 101889) TaxID=1450537 RepID=A0A395HKU1_ASPHC|nr:hypothetical protein BO97DRAFT_460370 [Aspergillus homomorphus CBS 101889]RAL08571.1 hypothetical protein BO97DRAFT_460370 [Aspergillus homomorphus CBS 101889]